MAGFIPRANLAFLWNPLSGASPFRETNGNLGGKKGTKNIPQSRFFLKGVAPESGFHRNAKIARGMNPATPFPPSRVGAVQAEVL